MIWLVIIGSVFFGGFLVSMALSQHAKATGNKELEQSAPAVVALIIVIAVVAGIIALMS